MLTGEILPWERYAVRLPRPDDESAPALLIEIRAQSHEAAEVEGARIYSRAREVAGLPPAPALILGALTPLFADAPHARLLDQADGHVATGRYEWAVVRAQTACEIYAQKALDRIARDLPENKKQGSRLFRHTTLLDPGDRTLFPALTAVASGTQDWWSSYRLHVQRRHEIVHTALSVSEDEAVASLKAARSFIAFLQEQWAQPRR